ncbi:conserved domain protein [Myxococcus xanthus DK 1622]|uniref:Conserved domain protein n=1 Tax=Myxococcus xanthus (strain DK1622) TaxID=246197 RepID=Q1CX64_MYXXD|nr:MULTISPECIES: outer membrane exchange protein TraA [Myxococcus]ABF92745.1 conserved domain protein [Myxococcus xanthus DK 1622]NOJ51243.1 outer membrane exchange protein TraA [Myxococcus xanthus]QPM79185.1 outer membrane exchange protein TraA [Myxococcus xanthus]QVW68263.1 outer membrane exchange protein TraA [Myxococcus xanthus DZ2]UEO05623.1 outer membrane exchange protein TraA [Myxococcus xanthus DZ2]
MGDIPHCCGALKSPLSRIARTALTVLSVCLASVAQAQPEPGEKEPELVRIRGTPVAPSPGAVGTGLCMASSTSSNPAVDFSQSEATFPGTFNAFMESSRPRRVTSVLRTLFDLSNNITLGDPNDPTIQQPSYGDFVNSVGSCGKGGCASPHPTFSSFGARFRGYINVQPQWVEVPLHFGLYADDAVSFVIYDLSQTPYQVINRPPQLGIASWRTTNTVVFERPGLYPVEILYAQVSEHSALEFSTFVGAFPDTERGASTDPIVKLNTAGFALAPPELFFHTEGGRPSFPDDINRCEQCNRQFANIPGTGGCGSFYHCNAAALCAPCDSSLFCGEDCSPCGESAPHCANLNGRTQCVQCTEDGQCPNGRCDLETNQCTGCNEDSDCATGACDTETFTCVECKNDSQCTNGEVCATDINECRECTQDSHCPQGESCTDNVCSPCATNDSCAGNSCNCCPNGTQCLALTPGATPTCVECTTSSQCAAGQQCDTANGRCVDSVPSCNTADSCGPGCVKCPGERPYCLDGEVCVQCRNDLECGDGQFCLSGECASCTTDKHCGPRCGACDGDTPFCLSNGTAQGSTCVGCTDDGDCGSGVCNPTTRTCENSGACAVTCEPGTVCDGTSCVECFADAHCPCGGTCDTATNTCSTACSDSGDCLGVEHCSAKTMECERGRRKPGTEPQGGAFCCGTTADATPAGSTTFLLLLAAGLTFLRPRRPAR